MAKVSIVLSAVRNVGNDQTIPVLDARLSSAEMVPSASNQVCALTSTTSTTGVFQITTDTNIYVAFGTAPNALTGTTARDWILVGQTRHYSVPKGWKVAIVTD